MTQQPALVVMAAGMGSRYGGLKQIDPIGPNDEIVIDYSIYDALRAGFGKIVFLIRKEIEDIFREKVGRTVKRRVETVYAYQDLCNVPPGFEIPAERKKPWGTGHAVLSCKNSVNEPFAVINADDFYGPTAFAALADYLRGSQDLPDGTYDYSMVGYVLSNTLSEHGSVARGVCDVNADGFLKYVQERTKIQRMGDEVAYTEDGETWVPIPDDSIVSMNMFGFTPSIFTELEARFPRFLAKNASNLSKAEYFLPAVVNELLEEGKARVKVLPTAEKWFGITNPGDRPLVQAGIRELIQRGVYPQNLWT